MGAPSRFGPTTRCGSMVHMQSGAKVQACCPRTTFRCTRAASPFLWQSGTRAAIRAAPQTTRDGPDAATVTGPWGLCTTLKVAGDGAAQSRSTATRLSALQRLEVDLDVSAPG